MNLLHMVEVYDHMVASPITSDMLTLNIYNALIFIWKYILHLNIKDLYARLVNMLNQEIFY